jgi:hypothetical protein
MMRFEKRLDRLEAQANPPSGPRRWSRVIEINGSATAPYWRDGGSLGQVLVVPSEADIPPPPHPGTNTVVLEPDDDGEGPPA